LLVAICAKLVTIYIVKLGGIKL